MAGSGAPNTKAFFAETIANPKAEVLDIEGVAESHEVGVPLVVDNTIATPYLIRPLEWGADVVIHSATKYLGGHGVHRRRHRRRRHVRLRQGPREVPELQHARGELPRARLRPRPRRGGALGANLATSSRRGAAAARPRVGDLAVQRVPRRAGRRDAQPEVERRIENARKVAAYLEAHPQVESVRWASLDSSPSKALADKYAPKGAGAVLAFEIAGGLRPVSASSRA